MSWRRFAFAMRLFFSRRRSISLARLHANVGPVNLYSQAVPGAIVLDLVQGKLEQINGFG